MGKGDEFKEYKKSKLTSGDIGIRIIGTTENLEFIRNLFDAAMAELVDALGSGSSRRTPVRVRVPLAADNFFISSSIPPNYI